MGAVVLMAGVVCLVLGAAGLFSGESVASYRRLRERKPATSLGYLAAGVVLITVGATLLAAGV